MKSFSSRDMELITRPLDRADAMACLKSCGQEVGNLSGSTFVAKANDGYWHMNVLGVHSDGTEGIVQHIDIFHCFPVKLGVTWNSRKERAKQEDPITYKTRIELRSADPFTALTDMFLFNPRYNEHKITYPQPLYLAAIPKALRVKPPYFLAGKNLFVAYAPTPSTDKKKGQPPTLENCAIFAVNANNWAHTVAPARAVQRILSKLGL